MIPPQCKKHNAPMSQRKISQLIHPIGGVMARLLRAFTALKLASSGRTSRNIVAGTRENKQNWLVLVTGFWKK
jgi:hypothetical protein